MRRRFQEMGGGAVPQRVGRYPFRQMRGSARLITNMPDGCLYDRALRISSREEPGPRPVTLPVDPKQLKQFRREHHLAISMALSLTDADELALAVDVRHLQVDE